ncbi:MAG: MazG family protein [Rhodoluna sp.]
MTKIDELIETARQLRAPGGCPWDAEQTHQSLTKYLIEETYELIEAIESNDRQQVLEELGDVLYHVVFNSDLAESGSLGEPFNIQDVAELSIVKMKGRHPHVFGSKEELEKFKAETGDDVMQSWDAHKMKEKPERQSVLDGIPSSLPALLLADKVIGKAQKLGVLDSEAKPAFELANEEQLGGLLLALVLSAKQQGLDSERALRETLRELQVEIRTFELSDDFDAGVIGKA